MNRSSTLIIVLIAIGVAASPAFAIPMDYDIFRSSNPSNTIGTFILDPALAAPVGLSNVQMTALTFSSTIPPFGLLTVTLDDIQPANVSSFRGIFYNGEISTITAAGSGTLPGGIDFFLDFTDKPDPTMIDLNAVGTFAFDAGDGIVTGKSATGSIGIRAASVPEPASLLLLLTGFTAVAIVRKRQRCNV